MEDITYNTYLTELLENKDINPLFNNNLTLDLYLTLLSLNSGNYSKKIYQNEINIIEDFLRKINNLKVKIQLKRKETEIDNLIDNIKKIYEANSLLISKYNKDNDDIISIIDSKETTAITNIIDKLTKIKIHKIDTIEYYDKLRDKILNNIYRNNHHIIDNTLYIGDDITLSLDEFYQMFDYLLDINNYKDIYHNKEDNKDRSNLIINIINSINNIPIDNYIPVVLTYLFTNNNIDYTNIDTSKFNIDNIKISELYSLANNNIADNNKTAKWKKVLIPNDYLYQKIKEMVNSGMYYFKNNIFIMESINDFKISITKNDLITFLKENLNKLNENITKHI